MTDAVIANLSRSLKSQNLDEIELICNPEYRHLILVKPGASEALEAVSLEQSKISQVCSWGYAAFVTQSLKDLQTIY